MFNARVYIRMQRPSRRPPLKALLSRQPGTAWAGIIFQPLDCRCSVVARLPRRKQHNLGRGSQSLMNLWPKGFGRTATHLDNAFSMRAKIRRRGSEAEALPVERAVSWVK